VTYYQNRDNSAVKFFITDWKTGVQFPASADAFLFVAAVPAMTIIVIKPK
jgi:hypothetical protein